MAYEPQPGTVAFRAIEWLKRQPAGTELTASVWAEAIDSEGSVIITSLNNAVQAGLVKRRHKDGNQRLVWWSLGDGVPLTPPEPNEDGEQMPQQRIIPAAEAPKVECFTATTLPTFKPTAPDPEPKQEPVSAGRPMTMREIVEAEEKPAERPPFDAWFSGVSGEVVLQGAHIQPDGDVVLSKVQVRQLLAALTGCAA